MKLKLSISPCPNDTFIFDALINGRIDPCGLDFEVSFADIEELNRRAIRGESDVCKISYAILPLIDSSYKMLSTGSALGRGNGPLLVSRNKIDLSNEDLHVAIPGIHTTANLLTQRILPSIKKRTPVLFSEIAERVAAGEFDAGVLIHEGRFTYTNKKLYLCCDLGIEWERQTQLPLPLGGIAVSRRLGEDTTNILNDVIQRSVKYAMAHPAESREFTLKHAQEMDEIVISQHISLFVNDFSVCLGQVGREAVKALTGVLL